MDNKKYIVYVHVNKLTGKIYIGITCQRPEYRWGIDGKNYRGCPYFWNAIQKYGWNNFDHNILFTGLTHKEACQKEIELIGAFKSNDPRNGYNISVGGDGFDSERSKKMWADDSFKQYASEQMRRAWLDPRKRKQCSDTAKKRWADVEFKKYALQQITAACATSVLCIETGEQFHTIKAACEKYNVCHANICRACKTGYRCGGLHWEYVNDAS